MTKITAREKAKSNLTRRKNPVWNNLDRIYNYLTRTLKAPHHSAIALMANITEESLGNPNITQIGGGGGHGLIQWTDRPAPKGLIPQIKAVWDSVSNKANVYNPKTKQVENYWKKVNGLSGEQVRQRFNNPNTPLEEKTRLYTESYLRAGKPRHDERGLTAMQLDSIYNPDIQNNIVYQKKGGSIAKFKTGSTFSPEAQAALKDFEKANRNFYAPERREAIQQFSNTIPYLIGNIRDNIYATNQLNQQEENLEDEKIKTLNDYWNNYNNYLKLDQMNFQQLQNPNIHYSTIVGRANAASRAYASIGQSLQNIDKKKQQIAQAKIDLKGNMIGNVLSNLGRTAVNVGANYLSYGK